MKSKNYETINGKKYGLETYKGKQWRMTDCCGSASTISVDDETLCCKSCWKVVDDGQGDFTEEKNQSKIKEIFKMHNKRLYKG